MRRKLMSLRKRIQLHKILVMVMKRQRKRVRRNSSRMREWNWRGGILSAQVDVPSMMGILFYSDKLIVYTLKI